MIQAFNGSLEPAAEVVVPGAEWVGLGASPDAFVEGSGPYAAFDIQLACTSDGVLALCDVNWNDLWVGANPDLNSGGLRVQAEVTNGKIVAFREFLFDEKIVLAFDSHLEWLRAERPQQEACATDAAGPECAQLLVDTVEVWVASR